MKTVGGMLFIYADRCPVCRDVVPILRQLTFSVFKTMNEYEWNSYYRCEFKEKRG